MHCPLLHQTPFKFIYIRVDNLYCPHSTVRFMYMQYAAFRPLAARIEQKRMVNEKNNDVFAFMAPMAGKSFIPPGIDN